MVALLSHQQDRTLVPGFKSSVHTFCKTFTKTKPPRLPLTRKISIGDTPKGDLSDGTVSDYYDA
jgi:hypothetical protein